MMKLCLLLVLLHFLYCNAFCCINNNNNFNSNVHKSLNNNVNKDKFKQCKQSVFNSIISSTVSPGIESINSPISSKSSKIKDIVAKGFGYLIGIGAMTVYTPIAINILSSGSADGYSISTWISNVIGLSAASLYPLKKGFPISTFIELLSLAIQSVLLMGIICFYQGHLKEFSLFMIGFSTLIGLFLTNDIPPKVLSFVQLFAIIACNYANIPQIVLNYQQQKASWSIITALLSVIGNFVRILTTLHLTKDKLILFGYFLGFFTNSILFLQVLLYK